MDSNKLSYTENAAIELIVEELIKARNNNPKFNSTHEGFAVLMEEVDELWEEVKQKHQIGIKMQIEAIQVGAMAIRFLTDCCPVGKKEATDG